MFVPISDNENGVVKKLIVGDMKVSKPYLGIAAVRPTLNVTPGLRDVSRYLDSLKLAGYIRLLGSLESVTKRHQRYQQHIPNFSTP